MSEGGRERREGEREGGSERKRKSMCSLWSVEGGRDLSL